MKEVPRPSKGSGNDWYVVTGNSMGFFLRPGDRIRLVRRQPEDLRAGDVVVLFNAAVKGPAAYVVHRLFWKSRWGRGWRLWTRGDWSAGWDPASWLPLGRVTEMDRNGVRFDCASSGFRLGGLLLALYSWSLFRLSGFYERMRPWCEDRFLEPALAWSSSGSGPARLLLRRCFFWILPGWERLRRRVWRAASFPADVFLSLWRFPGRHSSEREAPHNPWS